MPEHVCPHEGEIGSFKKTLDRIDKEVFGNGSKGLSKTVVGQGIKIDGMEESLDKLATAYSALAKNDSDKEAVRKALGGALVKAATILGIAGTVVAIIYTIGMR